MPYSVNNTDSSLNFTVQDGAIDKSTLSVAMIGTNAENYGDEIAGNDIKLLENFASISKPSAGTILTGQLWYDKTDKVLRVYKGTDVNDWVNLETLVTATAPTRLTARLGERYFDTSNNKGYIFDGAGWKPTGYAGEETSALSGDSLVHNPTKFGAKVRAIFLKDTSGKVHPCLGLVYVNNSTTNELYGSGTNGETLMALFNHDAQFTADNVISTTEGDSINYYAELNATGGIGVIVQKGMNLRDDYVAEAVALATEAVQAQKSNALVVGGQVINASNFLRNSADITPSADISFAIGSPSLRYDHLYIQQITLGAGQEQLQFASDNNAKIGSSSKRAKEIYTYDLFASDDVTVGDDLTVSGNTNLTGNTDITNHLQVDKNITSDQTITGATFTDSTLQINSGSISSAINGTFSGTVQFGTLSDGTIGITAFADEDTMSSNSASLVPTQQSVKVYVDTEVATLKTYVEAQDKLQDLDFTGDSGTGAVIIGNATVDSASMTFTGGDGITTSGSGTTLTTVVDNTVVRTSGAQSIAGVKTFSDNAVFSGNITVNGTQTTINSATLSVADNEITLNSDATGSATADAGIEVERGDDTNVRLRWNETTNSWTYTNDGSAYKNLISLDSLSVTQASASGGGALSYNNTNGVFTYTPPATFDTNLATKSTSNLTEGTNLYYTDARVLTKINATEAKQLSDISYTSPNVGQTLQWSGSAWAAATPSSGVTTLVNLTDVDAGGSTTGQVLQKAANGNFTFGSVSSSDNYVDSLAFAVGTGILTAGRNGLADITVDLDGRYGAGTSNFDGAYASLSSKPTLYAEPGIFSGGGTPTLASGVTAAEVRSLIGAGTSSVDGAGTPAILSDGSLPTLNSGISAAEVRTLIGAGTSSSDVDTVYSAGTGITKSTAGTTAGSFSHADTSSVTDQGAVARQYISGMTFDTYGHVTGYTTGTESDQSFTDTNYYANGISFASGTGVLTVTRSGVGALTVNLDGRYSTSTPHYTSAITSSDVTTALGYTPPTTNTTYSNLNEFTNGPGFTTYSSNQATDTTSTVLFGTIRSTNDVVAYYSSDERLKDNIKPIENALEKLQKIRGVMFDWNDNQDIYEGHDTGVIAQEVREVLPEVVQVRDDGYLAVKYEKMIGLLVESIKDLKTEVDDLRQQLNEK